MSLQYGVVYLWFILTVWRSCTLPSHSSHALCPHIAAYSNCSKLQWLVYFILYFAYEYTNPLDQFQITKFWNLIKLHSQRSEAGCGQANSANIQKWRALSLHLAPCLHPGTEKPSICLTFTQKPTIQSPLLLFQSISILCLTQLRSTSPLMCFTRHILTKMQFLWISNSF